jgi:hypothetical protein
MTDQVVVETEVTVVASVFGEEDRRMPFVDLVEGEDHDAASIADADVLRLVAINMFDTNVEELPAIITGDERAELKVTRPQTNVIMIRGATILG